MPFQIIRNDITRVVADAIVNSANPEPVFAPGNDRAIYQAAGIKRLLAARKKIGNISPGEARITKAFRLPAKYIIHTVCPPWRGGKQGEWEILRACYENSLHLARERHCRSIAFPLIGTGSCAFPKEKALDTALFAIRRFLEQSEMHVTLTVLDGESFRIASGLREHVQSFIDENYVEDVIRREYSQEEGTPIRSARLFATRKIPFLQEEAKETFAAEPVLVKPASEKRKKTSLRDMVDNLGESFQERLLRMIDERNLTDPQVYKRANLDRKLFSKIRCNPGYIPKKKTILALAFAMDLNLDDTRDLLASAGLALTNNSKSDVIVQYCLENRIHDIFQVNTLLFEFEQPLLS